MFKYSKYNIVYSLSENQYLIANSLYETKCKIITHISPDQWEKNINNLETRVLSLLLDKNIIVPIDKDEELLNQYYCYKKLYNNNNLKVQIILGHQCNFDCSYCWQEHTSDCNLSEDAIMKFPKFLDSQLQMRKMVNIDWIGGEPLLYKKTIDKLSEQCILIAEKHHCNYSAAMTTNGFLLDDNMQKNMIYHNKVNCFMITLDGIEETHNLFRPQKGGKGSFSVVKENICNLLVNKPRYVSVIVRINISPELIGYEKEIADVFKGLPKLRNVIFLAVPTVDPEKNEIKISFDEYFDFCIKMKGYGVLIRPVYSLKFMSGVCSSAYDNFYSYNRNGIIKKCVQGDIELPIDEFYQNQKRYTNISLWMKPQKLLECAECKLLPMCQGLVCPVRKENCHLKMVLEARYGQLLDEDNILKLQI